MISEHEKLKAICEKIGYDPKYTYFAGYVRVPEHFNIAVEMDVREIIFTQEFMDKFIGYRKNWKIKTTPTRSLIGTFYFGLMGDIEEKGYLDNPCDYLYNLLFNGEEKGK